MPHRQRTAEPHPLNHGRRRAGLLTIGLTGAIASSLVGCGLLRQPSPIGMEVVHDDAACAHRAPVLLVLLPGAYMTPAELQQQGFVAALRQRRLAVDVAIADAHLGYVYAGSMLERLHQDVIAPALAQGYRRIWLAGISLGGYVALQYARAHPGVVEGMVLLAPYLGRRELLASIAAAGGPLAWRDAAQPRDANDVDHALWQWLAAPAAGAPPFWLGYGSEDRLVEGHRLLAGLLASASAADRVSEVPGGHDWPPWRSLWASWLDRGLLPNRCDG